MIRPILGIDVDLTICPSDLGWVKWLRMEDYKNQLIYGTSTLKIPKGGLPYNLSELYPEVKDPYQYWRELDYSQFEPLEGSVEALDKLSRLFEIVFISQHKGQHSKSKYYWLEQHFPFKTGVILTKEKWLMKGSVVAMIDDRLDHLKGFDFDQRVLFNTNYTQSIECDVPYSFSKWDESVVDKLCEMYL